MKEPVCTALLFADRVIIENNGKKGIIGTFSKIFAQSFPAQTSPWGIYAAATNIVGKHEFALTLSNIETNAVVVPISGTLQSQNPEEVLELTFNTAGVSFPTEGKYSLSFTIDGELLGSIILYVEQVKQPSS